MLDGIKFWIARSIVEWLEVLAIVAGFGLVFVVFYVNAWWHDRRAAKRRAKAAR